MRLILASASSARQRLLTRAGIAFEAIPATIDERAVEAPIAETGAPADDIALALAIVKAQTVSEAHPGALVIGADQTLEVEGERLSKPADMEAARLQLLRLQGRRHTLHSAVVLVEDGAIIWNHVESAHMTMRSLAPEAIGRFLAAAGTSALGSVGACEIEGLGVRLMERVDGDLFTVQGLPMLPLLAALRERGALDEF